jgi:Flp pilus assembly protein TadD
VRLQLRLLGAIFAATLCARAADQAAGGPRPERDWSRVATVQDYLDRAEYYELQGQFQFAANDYAKAIGLFPPSLALRKGAGRLAVETNRFADAAAHLRAALAQAPADAEAHYYLGLALAGQGEDREARREWTAAREDAAFGPLAAIESAAALARTGNARAAVDALRAALRNGSKPARAGAIEAALLRAAGDTGAAAALASAAQRDPTDFVTRYESLRQGGTDEALWEHLAADPERVLEIADLYMHWGLYGDALAALEYKYPAVPANRTEPGAVLPQDYALVAYYRGYCRERLGKDAAEDYRTASSQPMRYVFPNRAGTLLVLAAALRRNPADASAHYLLGLEYLNAGMVVQAAGEWRAAQQARPGFSEAGAMLAALPAVLPRLPEAALPVPDKLAELAPAKLALAAPPAIRPGLPPRDIAVAALLNAALGNLDGALAAFNSVNFPQEKQDELVREAWIELQLQHLLALAAAHQCAAADQGITTLGYEDKSLPFTFRGFGAFTKRARFQYQLGLVEAACLDEKSARRRWERVAKAHTAPGSTDFAYPYLAAAKVNPAAAANAKPALEEVQRALATAGTDTRGALLYSQGLLLQLGQRTDEAVQSFREGLSAAPQGMVQYLNAGALRTLTGTPK